MHTNVQLFQKFIYFSFTFPACPCPPNAAQRCHCETSPQTGRGNPSPRPTSDLSLRGAKRRGNPRPRASLCEGGVMAFGHDGGRDGRGRTPPPHTVYRPSFTQRVFPKREGRSPPSFIVSGMSQNAENLPCLTPSPSAAPPASSQTASPAPSNSWCSDRTPRSPTWTPPAG